MIRIFPSFALLCLIAYSTFGQVKKQSEFIFPEKDSEFSVIFPDKPTVETFFKDGQSGLLAEMIIKDGIFLRAETLKLPESALNVLKSKDDESLAKISENKVATYNLENIYSKVGNYASGKYVKIRGTTAIQKLSVTIEVYFYFGKKEIIALYACGYTKDYPTVSIVKFLNSLKSL